MVIELPEWDGWRIAGENMSWEVQAVTKSGKYEGEWHPTNYFTSLDSAIGYAYERTLRESPKTAKTIREVHIECEKTKSRLVKAVKGAAS